MSLHRQVIGFVLLREYLDGRYRIQFRCPESGKYVRKVIPASNRTEAVELARQQNRVLLGDRNALPGVQYRENGISVIDALEASIKSGRSGTLTARNYRNSSKQFIKFLGSEFPNIGKWKDIKPSMIRAYATWMQGKGLRYDTIRLYLEPIRQTSSLMHRDSPTEYQDVFKRAAVRLEREIPKDIEVLSVNELLHFLDWLRDNHKNLYPLACLQGLAGLRGYESAWLRYCDVDFKNETVTISDNPWKPTGKPKNKKSYRTIPVHPRALEAIKEHRSVSNPDEPVFLNAIGKPWKANSLANAWKNAITEARAADVIPSGFIGKNLRHTFATICIRNGVPEFYLKRQLGHSGGSILGTHYVRISVEDLKLQVMQRFAILLQSNCNVKFKIIDII